MYYKRSLPISDLLKRKSLLLLGPRQTGKSTLCRKLFPDAYEVNLMRNDTFRSFSARPELLRERITDNTRIVFIDEAQLLPEIFNEVQVLIDRDPTLRFILTGSSARKLRSGGINLLPGRIWQTHLHPFVYNEIPNKSLQERLTRGGLPGIVDSEDYKEELRNYVGLYLDQEIRAEALTRSIGDFSRFLTVAALTNGQIVNFTNVSQDAEVKLNTVRAYYQILCDTLVGFFLEPFRNTPSRKAVASPKFYFFDVGVVNGILDRFESTPTSANYGPLLEQYIFLELKAFCDYQLRSAKLNFWRTQSKIEVDFLLNEEVAIEVKATGQAHAKDEKGLHLLGEDIPLRRKIIVCMEQERRVSQRGVEILPIEYFLSELWNGNIVG